VCGPIDLGHGVTHEDHSIIVLDPLGSCLDANAGGHPEDDTRSLTQIGKTRVERGVGETRQKPS
jgi:hypothetical protein